MQVAFLLLIGLIGISPAIFVVAGPLITGLLIAYTALAVAIVGLSIRPGEGQHLSQIIRPVAILAIVPALWMIIQFLPIPIASGLVHAIWTSAQSTNPDIVMGSISLDRGATLIALTRYCFFAGVVFVATAVAIDRVRAEVVLSCLAILTSFAAAMLVVVQLDGSKFFDQFIDADGTAALTALAGLGVVMNSAAAVRAVERYETRRTKLEAPFSKFILAISLCLLAFAICLGAIILFASAQVIFVTVSGFAIFALVILIRRLGLYGWQNAVLAAATIIAMSAIAGSNLGSGDFTLRFTERSPTSLIPIATNILSDTKLSGNGAGSFGSLLPIYKDIDSAGTSLNAPTTAATIAIEMGRPAFWAILVIVIIVLMMLLRGALQRGRDSFYPTAGASSVVILMLEAFCNATLFATPVFIAAGAILGVALAQCSSRTSQL